MRHEEISVRNAILEFSTPGDEQRGPDRRTVSRGERRRGGACTFSVHTGKGEFTERDPESRKFPGWEEFSQSSDQCLDKERLRQKRAHLSIMFSSFLKAYPNPGQPF